MAAFVDGKYILAEVPPVEKIFEDSNKTGEEVLVDVGPLVGRARLFRTKERLPVSGGMGRMEMALDECSTPSSGQSPSSKRKEREIVFIDQERFTTTSAKVHCLTSFAINDANFNIKLEM